MLWLPYTLILPQLRYFQALNLFSKHRYSWSRASRGPNMREPLSFLIAYFLAIRSNLVSWRDNLWTAADHRHRPGSVRETGVGRSSGCWRCLTPLPFKHRHSHGSEFTLADYPARHVDEKKRTQGRSAGGLSSAKAPPAKYSRPTMHA